MDERRVEVVPVPDGMAWVNALLPAAEAGREAGGDNVTNGKRFNCSCMILLVSGFDVVFAGVNKLRSSMSFDLTLGLRDLQLIFQLDVN